MSDHFELSYDEKRILWLSRLISHVPIDARREALAKLIEEEKLEWITAELENALADGFGLFDEEPPC